MRGQRPARKRRSRRTTLALIGATVAVLLAVGLTVGLLESGSASQGQPARPPASTPAPTSSLPAGIGCSGQPPHVMTAPGTTFGAKQPLLAENVEQIAVCVYQQDGATAGGYQVSGAAAVELARKVNALPLPSADPPCPLDLGPTVVLTPAHGRPAVGNAGGCGLITNGTAERAGRELLISLIAKVVLHTVPPGRVTHGPAPS